MLIMTREKSQQEEEGKSPPILFLDSRQVKEETSQSQEEISSLQIQKPTIVEGWQLKDPRTTNGSPVTQRPDNATTRSYALPNDSFLVCPVNR